MGSGPRIAISATPERRQRCRRGVALLLSSIASGCHDERTSRSHHETPAAEISTSTVTTAAPLQRAPMCEALERPENMTRAEEALRGELTVSKEANFFDDAKEVGALGTAAGASVELYFEAGALLDAESGARFVVVVGRKDLGRLAPYVLEGSLAELGSHGVAIGDALATAAKVRLGDRVRLLRTASWLTGPGALPTANARVAAIFSLPGEALHHDGERIVVTTLDTAQRLALSEREGITGLEVWAGSAPGAKPAQWLAKTAKPERYQVIVQGERWRDELATAREACAGGLRSSPARDEPRPGRRACDLPALIPSVSRVRGEVFGVARIQVPDPHLEDVAKTEGFSRVARRLETSAFVVSARGGRSIELFGSEAADRPALERVTVRGSIKEMMDEGGIAMSERLAAALEVDVGDEILVSVKGETEAPRAPAIRARVGAILSTSTLEAERMELEIGWMPASTIRERADQGHNAAEVAIVWVDPESLARALKTPLSGSVTDRPAHVDELFSLGEALAKQCP